MSDHLVKPKNSNVKDKMSRNFMRDTDTDTISAKGTAEPALAATPDGVALHGKFVKLWSAKLYLNITNIMRYVSPDEIICDYPYAFYFIHNLIEYFYKHGIYKKDLLTNNVKRLYRGIDSRFTMTDKHIEPSFLSTTWKLKVAEQFAQTGGTICIYPVEHLPDDIPFVVIDKNLGEYFREEEILFLPGTFHSVSRDDLISKFKNFTLIPRYINLTKYVPNRTLIEKYREAKPIQIGGRQTSKLTSKYIDFYSYLSQLFEPFIDTLSVSPSNGKYIIFYRAVIGRPVEIIHFYNIDKTESFFTEQVKFYDDIYDNITSLMPEVQDIRKILRDNNSTISLEDKLKYRDKLASYNISLALYNPVTREVEDFNYGTFKFMNNELYIKNSRNTEIGDVIKGFMEKKKSAKISKAIRKELEMFKTMEINLI
jgi:hypothetical protein